MSILRVLLADDHVLVRAGLSALLRALPDIDVVAEAGNGREALHMLSTCKPDLALLDIAMPGLNGLEVVTRAKKEFPHTRTLILSVYSNEEYVLQALRAGAGGYLLKDSALPELELAVRAVMRGESYLSPRVSQQVVTGYLKRTQSESNPLDRLTSRQREVLQLIAEGRNTHQIADALVMSVKTVETHRAHIMERLNIRDTPGLLRYAMRAGMLPPEEPGPL